MLKNLIRYGLAVAICGGAFVVSDRISQNLSRNAAIEFYEAQKFTPDRNVEFTQPGLQTYTGEAVKQASGASYFATVSVWLVSAGLIGIIFGSGQTTVDRTETMFKLFRRWIVATKNNDSSELVEIENEVRSNGGIGS